MGIEQKISKFARILAKSITQFPGLEFEHMKSFVQVKLAVATTKLVAMEKKAVELEKLTNAFKLTSICKNQDSMA